MSAPGEGKILLVVRPTRLDELVGRFNTVQQAQFYVEHLGADFSDYLAEHHCYGNAVTAAMALLREVGRVQRLERRYIANFVFGPSDSVVVLGQDGLVANTLKYLSGQPVVGVNPDPARWDGSLLPFAVQDLPRLMPEVMQRRRPVRQVTMGKAALNTGQVLYAVNDFFIGHRSHVSARYSIEVGGRRERQSSSGIIVSTGLGSTGWLSSVYAGWAATARALSPQSWAPPNGGAFPHDAPYLHYFVREPFPSKTTGASIVIGHITPAQPMELLSEMAENGVIFSDGIESDYLEFNSGARISVTVAERHGLLVI
jgi:hypothetical protein